MNLLQFDHEAYYKDLANSIFFAAGELADTLTKNVIARIGEIRLNKLDIKDGVTVGAIQNDVYKFVYPRSLRRVIAEGGKVTAGAKVAGSTNSLVALFYEYGTGQYDETPPGRFKHMAPNPLRHGKAIVGRPTLKGGARRSVSSPKGVKKWKGEEYPVIQGANNAILKHRTKGTKRGQPLPFLEVHAYAYMRLSLRNMHQEIVNRLAQAVREVNPKQYFRFQNVDVRK